MEEHEYREKGQTVVIVALALVVLLAALGLAVDGSAVYLSRRRMQNAADAASLAGTRRLADAICDSEAATAADAAVYDEVVRLAEANGVENADAIVAHYVKFDSNVVVEFDPPVTVGNSLSGGPGVPNGATGVVVSTTITQSTYFMGMVGQSTGGAGADATAVTGPPMLAGGMRPFGVPQDLLDDVGPGDKFIINFKHCSGDVCSITDGDGDPIAQHRGWMNLDYVWNQGEDPDFPRAISDAAGANDMKEWMENGWQGTLYADCEWAEGCRYGDYIHAKPGTNSSVIGVGKGLVDGDTGKSPLIYAPVFDVVKDCPTEIPDPKPGCPHQGGGYCYHIVGFVGVRILGDGTSQGGGTLALELDQAYFGEGLPSPNPGYESGGGDACETHLMVISLWD